MEKENRYELYDELPFTKFSNSSCDIDLKHQPEILKSFVNAVNTHHGNTKRALSEVGSNESNHSLTYDNIS